VPLKQQLAENKQLNRAQMQNVHLRHQLRLINERIDALLKKKNEPTELPEQTPEMIHEQTI